MRPWGHKFTFESGTKDEERKIEERNAQEELEKELDEEHSTCLPVPKNLTRKEYVG